MSRAFNSIRAPWVKALLFIALGLAGLISARVLVMERYLFFLVPLLIAVVLLVFSKTPEIFALLVLLVNEEFFYLIPHELTRGEQYQVMLYFILPIALGWIVIKGKSGRPGLFSLNVLALIGLTLVAVLVSYAHGQPLILGLKAAKSYFLILYYFIFLALNLRLNKLIDLIVVVGVALTFINNVQYVLFGKINLFDTAIEMERAGQLRFLVGDFFTIFAPLLALGEYFRRRKRIFLGAFIYMAATVIFQGQTRAVIWGLGVVFVALSYFMERLNFKKVVLIAVPSIVFLIWLTPFLQSTFIGNLYQITQEEISGRGGNVGSRFDSYEYYLGEIANSPILGRGVWNDEFDATMGDNPEDLKYKGIHLGDIGITGLVFHMGALGLAWLIWLIVRTFRFAFQNGRVIADRVHPGIVGYFLFGLATLLTLNCFVHTRTIIYLALALALISRELSTPSSEAVTTL